MATDLSIAKVQMIETLAQQGFDAAQIAERVGCHVDTARKYMNEPDYWPGTVHDYVKQIAAQPEEFGYPREIKLRHIGKQLEVRRSGSIVVSITDPQCPRSDAQERLLAVAAKRNLTPTTGRVFKSGRGYYMECM
jgi:hypothetical protein